METNDDFAQQLRQLREDQGLTVRALAALTGVSTVTIWKWESGASKPRERLMKALTRALGVRQTSFGYSAASSARADDEPKVIGQPSPGTANNGPLPRSPAQQNTAQPEMLSDVVARAKDMISQASGVSLNQISVRVEY